MSNVLPFKIATHSGVLISDRDTLMFKLRDDLYGADLELIANKMGCHVSTLYAIRANRTKWPRHSTLLALIQVLGYELWLIKV